MSPAGGIAVIVLAAGRSARMGTSKLLLPLGAASAIERLIGSVSRANVDDIVVVTGHDAEGITPILDKLAVRRVHNAQYESGMFSSVRIGAKALADGVEAFLILPADLVLIRTEVLDRLIDGFRESGREILHPSCCGLRGHPPLISRRYLGPLLQADGGCTLQHFLCGYPEAEVEMEIDDLSILMDMDNEEDYRRMTRFAGFLGETADTVADAATGSPGAGDGAVSPEDALYLLSVLEVPDLVVRHCQTVAAAGEALAEALKPHVPSLDVGLVRAAGLLHDMARPKPRHAIVAQTLLANLGLSRLGAIVGAHMVIPAEQLGTPFVTEEQLVYLADKLVIDDRIAGLDERGARALSRRGQDPTAMEVVRRKMRAAQIIQERVETILQRPLDEVLPRDRRPSI